MNGAWHGFGLPLLIGAIGAAAAAVWALHASDAEQTTRLDGIEARALQARRVIDEGHERLAVVERELALLKQRMEGRP